MQEVGLSCAADFKDCRSKKMCCTTGSQCYEKDENFAMCRALCSSGPDPTDKDSTPWSCTALGPRTAGEPPPQDFTQNASAWVKKECSGAGQDCSKTRCCKEDGKQCFLKQKGWASCKAECIPGPDPEDDDNHPWLCKALGMRTPGAASGWGKTAAWVDKTCAGAGQGCLKSGCCKETGMQCYKKNDGWAGCLPTCTPGPLLTDKNPDLWNCTALGGRTPGIPQVSKNVKVAPWVPTHCSKAGANCNETKCCAEPSMQCYEKNFGWASCMRGCATGPHKNDPTGGDWNCKNVGIRTPRPWGSPSLYCFSVIRLKSYEAPILRAQINTDGGVGIFSCEQYDVFASDGEAFLGDGPDGQVRTHHFDAAPVGISVDGTAANTELFMNVWEAVKWVGRYKLTDWTLKVDPDAVLIPMRVRSHLQKYTGTPSYIVNCNKPMKTGPMMFGSLEIISKQAMEKYYANQDDCKKHLDFGEDRWLGDCLEQLGVHPREDFKVVGDNVCKGADCTDHTKAAYHPFKSEKKWLACYNLAKR